MDRVLRAHRVEGRRQHRIGRVAVVPHPEPAPAVGNHARRHRLAGSADNQVVGGGDTGDEQAGGVTDEHPGQVDRSAAHDHEGVAPGGVVEDHHPGIAGSVGVVDLVGEGTDTPLDQGDGI